MLRRLSIENFKGYGRTEISAPVRFNVEMREMGGGKTRIFDALWMLSMIARGAEASIARFGWWNATVPTVLKVDLELNEHGIVSYFVQVQQIGLTSVIQRESLVANGTSLLEREGNRFRQSGGEIFDIGSTRFAFGSLVARPFGDPTEVARIFLQQLWLLSPRPDDMVSSTQGELPPVDVGCRHLAQYIVSRQSSQPVLYGLMMAYVRDLGVDVTALTVSRDNFGRQYLSVCFGRGSGANERPFEFLSTSEKCVFLVAFLRAINEHIQPVCCVWDNPLNALGEKAADDVLRVLAKSFEHHGQILLLTQRRNCLNPFLRERDGGRKL